MDFVSTQVPSEPERSVDGLVEADNKGDQRIINRDAQSCSGTITLRTNVSLYSQQDKYDLITNFYFGWTDSPNKAGEIPLTGEIMFSRDTLLKIGQASADQVKEVIRKSPYKSRHLDPGRIWPWKIAQIDLVHW